MAMTVLVAYDITEDRVRARCAAILQAVGDRVQQSVYVCALDTAGFEELRTRLQSLINPERDSLSFYRQCGTCWADAVTIGQTTPTREALYWAVL